MISDNVEEKVLIACFFCERRLRIPITYSGRIRCPTCSKEFLVEGSNELKIDEVILTDEENKQPLEKIEDSPEIEIVQNRVGGFEFVIGLIIPPIPPIIILILLLPFICYIQNNNKNTLSFNHTLGTTRFILGTRVLQ